MKATEAKLLEFLKKSPQFLIPIYQRSYSWTERECAQLWADVMSAGRNDKVNAHFVGSIVYVEQGLYQVTSQAPLLVIDGQQRLTTVTLILEALARAVGDTEPMDGFSARKLRNYYLLNPEEDGERRFKLLLSQTDKASLIALLGAQPRPAEASLRIEANFELFEKWIAAANGDLAAICRGITKLIVVDISLNRDSDNPQLIFESLNSTGRKLSQADLIRNYVLMGLEPKLQTRLYEQFLAPNGGRVWPGGICDTVRCLHAALPHAENRRDTKCQRRLRGVQSSRHVIRRRGCRGARKRDPDLRQPFLPHRAGRGRRTPDSKTFSTTSANSVWRSPIRSSWNFMTTTPAVSCPRPISSQQPDW